MMMVLWLVSPHIHTNLKQHCIKVSQACFYTCIENTGWKCTMSVSTSLWHPQTGYVSWMLLEVNNKISYRLFFLLQNTTQRALFSSIICLPKWTNDTETVWLDNKYVFQVLILNYCSGMCFCGSRWESVPTHEHQFSCIYSLSSSVFSSQLFSSHLAQNPFICDCNLKWLADYLRTNPIETSGARCASPRRLANKRIGQIKSKKFRCSGRPVAPCHSAEIHPCWSSLFLRQALLFLCHLSHAAPRWPSVFLSAGSDFYPSMIAHSMSDQSRQKVLLCLSFAVLLLLNQYLPRWTWGQGERDCLLFLHFPCIIPHRESGFTFKPQWAEITSPGWC